MHISAHFDQSDNDYTSTEVPQKIYIFVDIKKNSALQYRTQPATENTSGIMIKS